MLEIDLSDGEKYFETKAVDEIFRHINEEVNKVIDILPKGLGCFVYKNFPIKNMKNKSLYVEYHYQKLEGHKTFPVPIDAKIHALTIFEGMPQEIIDNMNKVKQINQDAANLN